MLETNDFESLVFFIGFGFGEGDDDGDGDWDDEGDVDGDVDGDDVGAVVDNDSSLTNLTSKLFLINIII